MIKKLFYVYAVRLDGVIRYIGKGTNGRLHYHAIEARRINRRRARGSNTDSTTTTFYRNLAEAMRQGANITEEIISAGLSNAEAYRIEKKKIEELHKLTPRQLWNTIDERLIGITWEEYKRKRREDILNKPARLEPYFSNGRVLVRIVRGQSVNGDGTPNQSISCLDSLSNHSPREESSI